MPNKVGFRNLDSETFLSDSETFSLDSETLSSETFWADSETLFVGFRNFLGGFRNYFRPIQKLFSLDSPTLPNTDATQDLGQGSGGVGWDDNVPWPYYTWSMLHKIWAKAGVGWGGMITFLGLEYMVDATQDLG